MWSMDGKMETILKDILSELRFLRKQNQAWMGIEELADYIGLKTSTIYQYVNQQGGRVVLKAIDKPPQNFTSVLDLFKKTLEHEKKVTGLINNLVTAARKENDHATDAFLKWFVTEQVEEEANAAELVQKIKLIGKDGNGLLMIDSQLAARVFTPPQAEA